MHGETVKYIVASYNYRIRRNKITITTHNKIKQTEGVQTVKPIETNSKKTPNISKYLIENISKIKSLDVNFHGVSNYIFPINPLAPEFSFKF
jgi:hypothetical protein